jgi:hypothetical protein
LENTKGVGIENIFSSIEEAYYFNETQENPNEK